MDTIKKVNYLDYKDRYDEEIINRLEIAPESIDIETMRANLYGYTYTKEYAEGVIPDELSMDYWEERSLEIGLEDFDIPDDMDLNLLDNLNCLSEAEADSPYFEVSPQEELILKTIDSTGDGKTPETALYVIDVHQEYEYIERVVRFVGLQLVRQSFANGIDCLKFKDYQGNIENVYFDISRRFEVDFK